jgi:hypothetical protein
MAELRNGGLRKGTLKLQFQCPEARMAISLREEQSLLTVLHFLCGGVPEWGSPALPGSTGPNTGSCSRWGLITVHSAPAHRSPCTLDD